MSVSLQCPESSTKKDLIAYLQRIALYCHQLNITSKVKADVQNISGNLIVSGVGANYCELAPTPLLTSPFLCSLTVLRP